MASFQDLVIQALPGAGASAALVWLLRGWISERLKQSISHEYSEKLENHKSDLELRLQALRHDYEVHQLRTSLFFDHQRTAFAEILAKMVEINQEWWRLGYEEDLGFIESVPWKMVEDLRNLYHKHQLFLDEESIMALELLFEIYQDSLPFRDDSGELIGRDIQASFDNAKYLQPRIAALFQNKIGVTSDSSAIKQVALLGAIRILNYYHFSDIGLPVGEPLKIQSSERPVQAVLTAERNFSELIGIMHKVHSYLKTEMTYFHDVETKLARYLTVLDPKS